jgi:hypothetical protein
MSGGQKVVAITVLAVFALVMFNLSIWRRMRAALKAAARDGAGRETPDPALDDQRPANPPR